MPRVAGSMSEASGFVHLLYTKDLHMVIVWLPKTNCISNVFKHCFLRILRYLTLGGVPVNNDLSISE